MDELFELFDDLLDNIVEDVGDIDIGIEDSIPDNVDFAIDEDLADTTDFDSDDITEYAPASLDEFFDDENNIVEPDDFSEDGNFDTQNNLIVEGNVDQDLSFIQQQTGQSCSLMAQEQFVHRYTGQTISEEDLTWQAEHWGVFSPLDGTDFEGQTMVLDHFNIPHSEHLINQDIDDINEAISENKDLIIGVDAREFYQDTSFPPGAGHAVTIVGRGIDPDTSEVEGFYITDSNQPGTSRFVSIDHLENSWKRDLVSISAPEIA